ncbi:preprotein translocase subunit SecE [Candidatus Saccharibacteria bacterium]|nr:preprotein translocase subunit SecE [Candidatus Saccharibacteria bacterium]
MAHVTRIKAGDKKSEDKPKKSTSKNVKTAVKIAQNIVKEEKKAVKKEKAVKVKKEKQPGKFVRVITAPFRYVHDSWLEIRQVRWPNRKATWKLVGAIFIYSAFFIVLTMLLDALFNFIFSQIIR